MAQLIIDIDRKDRRRVLYLVRGYWQEYCYCATAEIARRVMKALLAYAAEG